MRRCSLSSRGGVRTRVLRIYQSHGIWRMAWMVTFCYGQLLQKFPRFYLFLKDMCRLQNFGLSQTGVTKLTKSRNHPLSENEMIDHWTKGLEVTSKDLFTLLGVSNTNLPDISDCSLFTENKAHINPKGYWNSGTHFQKLFFNEHAEKSFLHAPEEPKYRIMPNSILYFCETK